MSENLKAIFRITDDFDSFSLGATDKFRCIAKIENKQTITNLKTNEVAITDLEDNPYLILIQADNEAEFEIEFDEVVTDPPGDPDLTPMVIPFTGYFVLRPLFGDKRVSKITVRSNLLTAQKTYIGVFYAGE